MVGKPKVYQIYFSMRHYGAASVKPTMVLTNNKVFWALNPGRLRRTKREGTPKSYPVVNNTL